MAASILQHESRPLKKRCFGRSRSLPSINYFFLQKMFARLTLQFPFTYICICNRVRSVSFSDGVITWSWHNIQRWKRILYFVSLAAWLRFRHAKLTAGGKGRVRTLAIECVSFFLFFFPLPTVLAFFYDQTHTLTQTRKVRRHAERPKGDREQFASLDFWITD